MSGQILIATFPAQVTPCLPIFLHTYPTNFAAQTAIITLIFIVYDNFLYKYNLCYCRLFKILFAPDIFTLIHSGTAIAIIILYDHFIMPTGQIS